MKAYKTRAPSNGHLIVFYKVQLGHEWDEIKLNIDPEEVNNICWVSKENIKKIFECQEGFIDCIKPNNQGMKVELPLSDLFPTYPNKRFSGIGKAHSYALKFLYTDILNPF